jgi:hypothetical protein
MLFIHFATITVLSIPEMMGFSTETYILNKGQCLRGTYCLYLQGQL